jgi:hypothetical protein
VSKPRGIYVNLAPFMFPNFLRVEEWKADTFPVAHLSPQQAAEYWDELKPLWVAHVKKRSKQYKDEMAKKALENKP